MELTGLLDLGLSPPDLDEDVGNQDKYGVYLLGSTPIDTQFEKDSYTSKWNELLQGRSWSVCVLPNNYNAFDLDTRGTFFTFHPFSLIADSVDEQEPLLLEKVIEENYAYVVAHIDIEEKNGRNTHTGKKHYISPSLFEDDIPSFSLSKKDFESYITGLGMMLLECLQQLREVVSVKNTQGISKFFKKLMQEGDKIEKTFKSVAINLENEDKSPFHYKQEDNLRCTIDFLLNTQASFVKRIVDEFSPEVDSIQQTQPVLLRKEHRRFPIYGRKSLEKNIKEYERKLAIKQKGNIRRLGYSLYDLAKLSKPITKALAKFSWYYAKGTQEEIDNFLLGGMLGGKSKKKYSTKRGYDELIEIGKQLNPPVTKSEIASINQMFARWSKKIYFSTLAVSTAASLLVSPWFTLGIGGYTALDYSTRKYRQRSYGSETSGIIGVIRQYIKGNKK
jgi:hypothetical protein